MVHYPNPKYIKKSHVRGARPYKFSDDEKRADKTATHATCLRCAQTIANQKKQCDKPEHRRCEHCSKGNRGGCTQVPRELNGRLNRLIVLRGRYDAAVVAATTPKTDAGVIAAGVKLARCQRQFNLELANLRRTAAHTGTPIGVATQVPTTSPQFLGLILVEQRRIAAALEQLVAHAARLGPGAGAGDDDDDDSSSSNSNSEDDGGAPGRGAGGARGGRGGGAGGARSGRGGRQGSAARASAELDAEEAEEGDGEEDGESGEDGA